MGICVCAYMQIIHISNPECNALAATYLQPTHESRCIRVAGTITPLSFISSLPFYISSDSPSSCTLQPLFHPLLRGPACALRLWRSGGESSRGNGFNELTNSVAVRVHRSTHGHAKVQSGAYHVSAVLLDARDSPCTATGTGSPDYTVLPS